MAYSKYRNIPTSIGTLRFDSLKEVKRWRELLFLESAGQIKKLQRQVTFPLIVNGQLICKYRADFVYEESGQRIVEDCKGFVTREYKVKAKLLLATLGIKIHET